MSDLTQFDPIQPDSTLSRLIDEETILRKPEGWRPTPYLDTVEVEGRGTMTVTSFIEPTPRRFVLALRRSREDGPVTVEAIAGELPPYYDKDGVLRMPAGWRPRAMADKVEVEGRGTMTIVSVEEPYEGRFVLTLARKFEAGAVTIDAFAGERAPEPQ